MYDIRTCAHGHTHGTGGCLHAGARMQVPARAARTSTLCSVDAPGNRELDYSISKAPVSADTLYCRRSSPHFPQPAVTRPKLPRYIVCTIGLGT